MKFFLFHTSFFNFKTFIANNNNNNNGKRKRNILAKRRWKKKNERKRIKKSQNHLRLPVSYLCFLFFTDFSIKLWESELCLCDAFEGMKSVVWLRNTRERDAWAQGGREKTNYIWSSLSLKSRKRWWCWTAALGVSESAVQKKEMEIWGIDSKWCTC